MKPKAITNKITYIGRMKPLNKGTYSRKEITDPYKKTTPASSVDRQGKW